MEMVIFIGAQAAGKSSFFRHRFSDTHVRINLDMLKTRHRESILLKACFSANQNCVVDNTNSTASERQRYIGMARCKSNVLVSGFYFRSSIRDCIERNQGRAVQSRIPDHAIAATIAKLERPTIEEGFNSLIFVSLSEHGFEMEDWKS